MIEHSDKRHKRRAKKILTVTKHKVVVDFPRGLLERTEQAASAMAIDRSKLIRSAVEQYLEIRRKESLEQELAAGYQANAMLDRAVCEDFVYADAENI